MNFTNGAELVSLCERNGSTVAREMLARESELSGLPEEKLRARMAESYGVMKQAVQRSLRQVSDTMGGLIGGEAQKLYLHRQTGRSVCGPILSRAVTYAMGTLEVSASMGLIVAAPTAGSAGVIPGVFLAVQEEFGFSDGQMVDALFHAGAVGYLIMRNATISGAEGGCQAEVGSAGAMAASAVAALMGE